MLVHLTTHKKGVARESDPKFREETPKKGSDRATPIAKSPASIWCIAPRTQAPERSFLPSSGGILGNDLDFSILLCRLAISSRLTGIFGEFHVSDT
jgi:hypothetical protein